MLHVFDMDGTILPNTTASVLVAERCGTHAELRDFELAFRHGVLDTAAFALRLFEIWKHLDIDTVKAAFQEATWLARVPEVVTDIRRRNEHCIVITMWPDFFASLLLDWGFSAVEASRFPALPFQGDLDTMGILRPEDKPGLVEQHCARLGITADQCVAYGDSMSDAALFATLRHTVAVNSDRNLEGLARCSYRGADLWEAYQMGRALLTA